MKNSDDNDNKVNKNVGVDLPEQGGSSLADFVPNPVLTRAPDEAAPTNPPGSDLLGESDQAVDPESFKLRISIMRNIYLIIIHYNRVILKWGLSATQTN